MSSVSDFTRRHMGPGEADIRHMLKTLGVPSMETLLSRTIPDSIRLKRPLDLPEGVSEHAALDELHDRFNKVPKAKPLIGQGFYGTHTPQVILRNLFENPAWYTSYTPYQAEISQGRLELLFHFQTLIAELTGLPVANASLLDEATAIAEAAGMAIRHHRGKRTRVIVANELHPQNRAVLDTRLSMMDCEQVPGEPDDQTAAVIVQSPDTLGNRPDIADIARRAKAAGALLIVAADPMAMLLERPPGELGADICVGSMQRFGVAMGNGGPHAGFIGAAQALTRLLPGRLVGQSVDREGKPAYRLALQTREQHIRREKATSNICTAQALLANMAAAYAIWHGPEGLIAIAAAIHAKTSRLATSLAEGGYDIESSDFFDTLTIRAPGKTADLVTEAERAGFLLRTLDDDRLALSIDETVTDDDLATLCRCFGVAPGSEIPAIETKRGPEFLTQEVFHGNRSETAMMRFLRNLADKDLALDRAMIALGSCTMKLNAAAEMAPVSWSQMANVHPYSSAPYQSAYRAMVDDLDRWLSEITGFKKVSIQPNAGSQGEFAGLAAIRRFHDARGDTKRKICLIPESAHGTNPASAQMAGMQVVVVACDDAGNVDLADLRSKAAEHVDTLAALMITYPSTHGVFEESITDICEVIHDHGGQVYLDGANLNAMVGLARPGDFGADVCHLNLHKTFCIPHGGGGPGVGPIGVAAHLEPYLPGEAPVTGSGMVSSAPLGSASILPITWMYIRMMGGEGLRQASAMAILNANYLAARLDPHFPVLYRGRNGFVAHECILDTRLFRDAAAIDVEDIAKRLIDYGFHAPTMSWPVPGTLMIEPTESEPRQELDRFADAMAAIRAEIDQIAQGQMPKDDNPLVNAPHCAGQVLATEWNRPYTRETAANPAGLDPHQKYWPPVSRVDNVFGDRNLVCTCPPVSEYAKTG